MPGRTEVDYKLRKYKTLVMIHDDMWCTTYVVCQAGLNHFVFEQL